MKTVHFCNLISNKVGAYELLLASVGKEFNAHGDRLVMVFAGEPIPEVAELLREQNVEWRIIEGWGDTEANVRPWRFCLPAVRILRKERPDVAAVHFGNEMPSVLTRFLSWFLGCRRLRWVWEQDQQIQNPISVKKWFSQIRLVGLLFDRLVAVYDGARNSFLLRQIPEQRIRIIYNPVGDYQQAKDKGWLRSQLGVANEDVLLVSTGWLVRRKRIDFILKSFKYATSRCEQRSHLVLLGDGPEKERLTQMAQDLGIADQIHFLGVRNDVREILNEADILVHSSVAETCTYAITESMCAGIPAVVTEAGAAREQIVNGETGYVLERDDMDGFVDRILGLMKNGDLRCKLGRAARERWSERYRLEVSASKYYELYRSLADEK